MTVPCQVLAELAALSDFYEAGGPGWDDLLGRLAPWLGSYAELVLAERHLEVIAGSAGAGAADGLAALALRYGALPDAAGMFRRASSTFPRRMLGLKVVAGPGGVGQPSLYVRALCPRDEGLGFLADAGVGAVALDALRARLETTRTLYGLGFFACAGGPAVKTYTIGELAPLDVALPTWLEGLRANLPPVGFVSHRLAGDRLSAGVKLYWPDVAWERIGPAGTRWRAVLSKGRALGYARAGHVGLHLGQGEQPALKLYVERVGAIPTDFAAR